MASRIWPISLFALLFIACVSGDLFGKRIGDIEISEESPQVSITPEKPVPDTADSVNNVSGPNPQKSSQIIDRLRHVIDKYVDYLHNLNDSFDSYNQTGVLRLPPLPFTMSVRPLRPVSVMPYPPPPRPLPLPLIPEPLPPAAGIPPTRKAAANMMWELLNSRKKVILQKDNSTLNEKRTRVDAKHTSETMEVAPIHQYFFNSTLLVYKMPICRGYCPYAPLQPIYGDGGTNNVRSPNANSPRYYGTQSGNAHYLTNNKLFRSPLTPAPNSPPTTSAPDLGLFANPFAMDSWSPAL